MEAWMSTESALANPSDLKEWAIQLYNHLEGQIARADTEAQLTLAVDAILVAGVTTYFTMGTGQSLLNPSTNLEGRLRAGLAIGTVVFLCLSLLFSLLVTRPRLKAPAFPGLAYFGQIAQVSEDQFAKAFKAQTSESLERSILSEVHAKAKIAKRKFAGVSWSVTFLMLALACWASVEAFIAFG
jgi:hypothetical protein